jgi:hypothetical protein
MDILFMDILFLVCLQSVYAVYRIFQEHSAKAGGHWWR